MNYINGHYYSDSCRHKRWVNNLSIGEVLLDMQRWMWKLKSVAETADEADHVILRNSDCRSTHADKCLNDNLPRPICHPPTIWKSWLYKATVHGPRPILSHPHEEELRRQTELSMLRLWFRRHGREEDHLYGKVSRHWATKSRSCVKPEFHSSTF